MHGFQNPADADRSFEEDGRFPLTRNRRHSGFAPSPAVSAMRRVSTIARWLGRHPEATAAIACIAIWALGMYGSITA